MRRIVANSSILQVATLGNKFARGADVAHFRHAAYCHTSVTFDPADPFVVQATSPAHQDAQISARLAIAFWLRLGDVLQQIVSKMKLFMCMVRMSEIHCVIPPLRRTVASVLTVARIVGPMSSAAADKVRSCDVPANPATTKGCEIEF